MATAVAEPSESAPDAATSTNDTASAGEASATDTTAKKTTTADDHKSRPSENVGDQTKKRTLSETDTGKSEYAASVTAAAAPSLKPLLEASLYDMVNGLPRAEMKLIIDEAKECEQALEEELEMLKKALEQEQQFKSAAAARENNEESSDPASPEQTNDLQSQVELMLESEITPPDHYWSVSALLGRLRHDLTTPLPPNSQLRLLRDTAPPPVSKKRKSNTGGAVNAEDGTASGRSTPNFAGLLNNGDVSQFERLQQIQNHPDYKLEHENPDKLLAVWKKISTHRSSLVFRRPVNPKDAPGYSDRIRFPMDLSLIRKLIANRTIRSYYDIAQRIHLIGHNCVKYNGRESDYALVTREFESYCAEYLINATLCHSNPNAVPISVGRPGKKRSVTPTTGGGRSSTPLGTTSRTTSPKEGIEQTTSSSAAVAKAPSNNVVPGGGPSGPTAADSAASAEIKEEGQDGKA